MIISFATVLLIITIAYLVFRRINSEGKKTCEVRALEDIETKERANYSKPQAKKLSKVDHKKKGTVSFVHPWLSTILKGHAGPVSDFGFSGNGRYLASCSEDRSIIIWNSSEFEQKEHKIIRTTLDFDQASKICFAPDSKSLLLYLNHDNNVVVYKIVKKDTDAGLGSKIVEVEGVKFKCDAHKMDVISVDISCNGKFLVTASSDTTIVVWDLKGNILKILDTKQGNNYEAKVSPCGHFVACSGFTPDVKIWEVVIAKNGDFSDIIRAFELKGHKSGVRSFDFNQASTRMASVSKDGTWRLWDTEIHYRLGQEPRMLMERPIDDIREAQWVSACLAPDSRVLAIACDRILRFFSAQNGDILGRLTTEVEGTPLLPFSTSLKFTSDSKYLIVGRDKQILVFHNVPGYMVLAQEAQQLVKKASSAAHKERLVQ